MKLHLVPGQGRAFRFGSFVGFSHKPIDEIPTMLRGAPTHDPEQGFKQLSELVVDRGHHLPAFVVVAVHRDHQGALIFGDIVLNGPDGTPLLNGSTVSTWSHTDLSAESASGFSVGCQSTDYDRYHDTMLESGVAPAGGFWYGPVPTSINTPLASFASGIGTSLDDWPLTASTHVVSSPSQSTELKAYPPPRHPGTLIPTIKSARICVPVTPNVEPATDTGLTTAEQASLMGSLRFDDGQVVSIDSNLYVGRFPARSSLPPNTKPVVVRGECVSRLHWALIDDPERGYVVKDLGSTGGTYLDDDRLQRRIPLKQGEECQLTPGTTIRFGDRWARFEPSRQLAEAV